MELVTNAIFPKIIIYDSDTEKNELFTFDPFVKNGNSQNLQRYNFSKSTENTVGQFSFSFKPDTTLDSDLLYDRIKLLDVVQIFEDESNIVPSFIGVIRNKSVSCTAGTGQKLCTISGLSIECLFDMFNIASDSTAGAIFFQKKVSNVELLDGIYSVNGGIKAATVKEIGVKALGKFFDIAKTYSAISSSKIGDLIKLWYGITTTDSDEVVITDSNNFITTGIDNTSELELVIPIATPLISGGTANYITYLRSFLPENVYQLYGYISEDGSPKLRIQLNPFAAEDWIKLKRTELLPIQITDYAFTQSDDEVYTAFISYVEGSPMSPEFWQNVNAGEQGNKAAERASLDLCDKYGYRPLFCTFSGFDLGDKNKDDANEKYKNMSQRIQELNVKVKDWYENLPLYNNGSITCVGISGRKYPKIGERVKFSNMEFYVVGESHSWSYNNAITITYDCTRGGMYDNKGAFSPIKGLSKSLMELGL